MKKMSHWTVSLALLAVALMAHLVLAESAAWARAGGGGSMGSRGSRSFSTPARPSSPGPSQGYTPRPSSPMGQPSPGMGPGMNPSTSGSFARNPFVQGMAGGLLGGFVGNMLFGSRGHSAAPNGAAAPASGLGGSGIGLMDLLLIGGGIYLLMRYLRKRREQAATATYYDATPHQQQENFGGYMEPNQDTQAILPLGREAAGRIWRRGSANRGFRPRASTEAVLQGNRSGHFLSHSGGLDEPQPGGRGTEHHR